MDVDFESLLRWATNALGPGATIVETRSMRADRGPWLLRVESRGGETIEVVLKVGLEGSRAAIACESAALECAESHSVPAPRPLAVDLDGTAGSSMLLVTALPGTSDVPAVATPARLRALGAAAANFHRIPLKARPNLPLRLRHMPWIDLAMERRWADHYQKARSSERPSILEAFLLENSGWDSREALEMLTQTRSTALLDAADARLREITTPQSETVFVHGDLWQGNTMWLGDTCAGIIDWEAAGVGHYGVDLCSLRWDSAILFGLPTATEVLVGWEEAIGRKAENVAYWDIVTALNSSADMEGFLPTIHAAGRRDLTAEVLNDRRDEFLRDALERLNLECAGTGAG